MGGGLFILPGHHYSSDTLGNLSNAYNIKDSYKINDFLSSLSGPGPNLIKKNVCSDPDIGVNQLMT